jgi:hypothetical protein
MIRRDDLIVTVLKPDGSYVITNVPTGFELTVNGDWIVRLVDTTERDEEAGRG